MKQTKIINLFGGPGISKSTTASALFALMKRSDFSVELVGEYAKDVVWDGHHNLLDDQLWITANQNRRITRLVGKVDFVITDSPLLLGVVYAKESDTNLKRFIVESLFDQYTNLNFLLTRKKKYVSVGRTQSEEEAIQKDVEIRKLLDHNGINYTVVQGDETAEFTIIDYLLKHNVK